MATMKQVVMNQKYGNNKILFLVFFLPYTQTFTELKSAL